MGYSDCPKFDPNYLGDCYFIRRVGFSLPTSSRPLSFLDETGRLKPALRRFGTNPTVRELDGVGPDRGFPMPLLPIPSGRSCPKGG